VLETTPGLNPREELDLARINLGKAASNLNTLCFLDTFVRFLVEAAHQRTSQWRTPV
jgi:hypothetical protein